MEMSFALLVLSSLAIQEGKKILGVSALQMVFAKIYGLLQAGDTLGKIARELREVSFKMHEAQFPSTCGHLSKKSASDFNVLGGSTECARMANLTMRQIKVTVRQSVAVANSLGERHSHCYATDRGLNHPRCCKYGTCRQFATRGLRHGAIGQPYL